MTTLYEHNPTCDLRTYAAAQAACHHLSLLDADQQPVGRPAAQLLAQVPLLVPGVRPTGPSHTNVLHTRAGAGAARRVRRAAVRAGDADGGVRAHDHGLGVFEPKGHSLPPKRLVAAHFHCHAPTCLSISLLPCAPNSTTACLDKRLMCRESPLYGGVGPALDLKRFDEPGYIAQPPALGRRRARPEAAAPPSARMMCRRGEDEFHLRPPRGDGAGCR